MSAFAEKWNMITASEPGADLTLQSPRWTNEWCYMKLLNADGILFKEISLQIEKPALEDFNQNHFQGGVFKVVEKSFTPGTQKFCVVAMKASTHSDVIRFKWVLD